MRFAPTEGANVDALIFVGAWEPAITSEVPADADNTIVGGEEIPVIVF